MSKEKLSDTFSKVEWSEKSKGTRSKISVLILISMILGYIFLVLFNVVVAWSATGIRIETDDFDRSATGNETIGIEGDITIRNDHWYSLDINDLVIEMEIETEDHNEIYDKKITKSVIPRLKNTKIKLDFRFTTDDYDPALNETYLDLATTEELIIKFSVSVRYTIYIMTFEIEVKTDIE